ncbi:peroxisome proliferator-activated receptor gamma coactivator-related protein 1 [Pseudoliparis swirei]|uniref:peroxisome proliferator-activated receptor gamma coactivator-related protein 1 n=1 Tax=Pseudoliparis swirei TaxID=2059687 RepID=UPI0024BDF0CF|nr:peroxisome proliferator-activated receptor gamma coactivator-related protein 1 [Pseudoliparis swirei]
MAARWGAGEDMLTAGNMEFFAMDTLDEADGLTSAETLEALQNCSILSLLEDTPTIETRSLYEESEATLLTALTEILDNVDDENLSPFDTLPDSDLLSDQRGREHSPLRRWVCLSRSPPEKDTLCTTRAISTGKSLPRILADSLQRSDGEEEEDGFLTLSPASLESSPGSDQLHWEGLALPLPVTFEQELEGGISVCLVDLVRQMHPYCMSICMEDDEGEQMLPEGGILLEVVDQGENGEHILVIQNIALGQIALTTD